MRKVRRGSIEDTVVIVAGSSRAGPLFCPAVYYTCMSDPICPCVLDPMASTCGVWADNESACICTEDGILHESGRPLPA